jgi:hypothetical protein
MWKPTAAACVACVFAVLVLVMLVVGAGTPGTRAGVGRQAHPEGESVADAGSASVGLGANLFVTVLAACTLGGDWLP